METLMSIFALSARVAVVTGGNGGIGLGIAQALASAGCDVSIWGRNAEKNKIAAATMAGSPGKGDTQICDAPTAAPPPRPPQSRARRIGRPVRPPGRALEPGLAVRHRAQRALRRDQGR